LISLFL
jgi:E3 ubiquitin-protein ligase TRIP12